MLIRRKKLNNQPEQNDAQRLKTVKKELLVKGSMLTLALTMTVALVFTMTAAWFTNVASTGSLTFQVESWGFDGDVEVDQNVIKAAPGSSGYLSLKITSAGEKDSKLSVGISKEFMQERELQQRIFFYADTSSVVNGERVDKVYLTNTNAYSYYLPAQNQLILSEQVYTDVRLKWEWVYDVVGYYFRGTYDGTDFAVAEYLKPAQYNYDNATFDANGRLEKVDANTSVLQYLADLTANDGYAGAFTVGVDEITGKKVLMKDGEKVTTTLDCYPIDPANNIWLYLCSQREIQNNTSWDTQYGMSGMEAQKLFQVRLTVIGEQSEPRTLLVADANSLKNALQTGGTQTITLQQDVVLTETVQIPAGVQAVLNLNGHKLTCSEKYPISVAENGKLTVQNGTISGDSTKTVAFYSKGGQITLSKVQVENVKNGVGVEDHKSDNAAGANSFVRILDSQISAESVGVMLNGDGTASAEHTVLIVQNSSIRGNYMGISGNGTVSNPGRYGTDIQIVNSEVYGFYAGVYHPQMLSNMTVNGSTVSGMTGIAIKGGNVTVLDSTIQGLGTDAEVTVPTEDKLTASGYVDTGDAIYIEDSYGYPIRLTVSGNSILTCVAQTAQSVRVFPGASITEIFLTGGTYDTDVTAYLQPGYVCTSADEKYMVTTQQ